MQPQLDQQRISRILIVEDDDAQRQTLDDIVRDEGFETVACGDAQQALARLAADAFDVAIVDYRLPDLSGIDLLERIRAADGEVRVIIHTGYGSFESARDAVNLGAFAYVEKLGDPESLLKQVHRGVRERIMAALEQSEERLRTIMVNAPELILQVTREGRITYANRGLVGGGPADLVARDATVLAAPGQRGAFQTTLEAAFSTGTPQRCEVTGAEASGWRRFSCCMGPVVINRQVTSVIVLARDVTQERALEVQLRQAQKMEAIGTLAAGVAHDFNNILTAIFGYVDLAETHTTSKQARQALHRVQDTAQQAAGVCRALLTFSRQEQTRKSPLGLTGVVERFMDLLRRFMPATIMVHTEFADDPLWILADETQLQQVLTNLTLNARDAMPEGGELTICVRALPGEADTPRAQLIVEDTGRGMPDETRQRIFEPFFTTKPRERGTGLGLAIVHGIVTDHDGTIELDSLEDRGTRFTLTFPGCAPPAAKTTERGGQACAGRGERILLAEDNEQVCAIMALALRNTGYVVEQAADGDEAMRLFREAASPFQLAILDLNLPCRSGDDCLDEIRRHYPDLPAIIITGNPHFELSLAEQANTLLLRKPFQMRDLVDAVQQSLTRAEG